MDDVKKTGATRQEKAAATRRRMLDAAYELFCDPGYRATTMADIAERAGVAVQTLHFTFHTKDELLQEVHERTVVGDEKIPPQQQAWHRAALAETDVRRALRGLVGGTASINARVAPMLPTFHSVVADPAGTVFRRAEQLRLEGFEQMIAHLEQLTPLRKGLTFQQAVDVLFVVMGPEPYRTFVIERGWSPDDWVSWTTGALLRELFAVEPPAPRRRPAASARRPTLGG